MALLKLEHYTGQSLIVRVEDLAGMWPDEINGQPCTSIRFDGVTQYVKESITEIEEMMDGGKLSEPVKSKQGKKALKV